MLVLGSGSPRRREILTSLHVVHRVAPADVNEDVVTGESPAAYLERVVASKLAAVRAREGTSALCLVADTSVIVRALEVGAPVVLPKPDPSHRYRRPYEGTDVNPSAMQAYLDWEYGLVEQLKRDATHGFYVI